jgi:hypothetical protein
MPGNGRSLSDYIRNRVKLEFRAETATNDVTNDCQISRGQVRKMRVIVIVGGRIRRSGGAPNH